MRHLPNVLTISRLVMTPIIVLLMFLGSPQSSAYIGHTVAFVWSSLFIFTLAGISDYVDGLLARQHGWISRFGQLIDPIADKVLVVSVIAVLLSLDRLMGWHFIPAWIIIMREICIAGLREFMSAQATEIPVSWSGKIKTGIQFVSLGFLIAAPAAEAFLPATTIGLTLLWLAALVTLSSAYDYVKGVLPSLQQKP